MIKAGVIGFPIEHSLSPIIHNYWLEKYKINGTYEKIPVPPEKLSEELKRLAGEGYAGVNVTIPHKEKVLEFVTEISPEAKAIGAVNTITFKKNGAYGDNTDWFGFWLCLSKYYNPILPDLENSAVVIGAGGAARGVVWTLINEGFQEITIFNRTSARAEKLAAEFSSPALSVEPWEEIEKALPFTDLLVNTTSLGMKGQPPLEINLKNLNKGALVIDIVYNPLKTSLLAEAEKFGIKNIGGLDMLMGQAIPGFKEWFAPDPKWHPQITDELRQLLVKELRKK